MNDIVIYKVNMIKWKWTQMLKLQTTKYGFLVNNTGGYQNYLNNVASYTTASTHCNGMGVFS